MTKREQVSMSRTTTVEQLCLADCTGVGKQRKEAAGRSTGARRTAVVREAGTGEDEDRRIKQALGSFT